MADIEDNIQAENFKVDLPRLEQLVRQKEAELTVIIDESQRELKQIEIERQKLIREKEDCFNLVSTERTVHEERLKGIQEEAIQLVVNGKEETKKVREALKELTRVNGQVLSANNELEELVEKIKKAEVKLEDIANLIIQAESLKDEIYSLIQERNLLLVQKSTQKSQWEGEQKEAMNELSRLVYLAETKKKEASEAEARTEAYTKQLYTNMNDYQVVRARLEGVWEKTFPELKLPLE